MEVFGLQVNVELFVTNLERTAAQIKNRLKEVRVDPKAADSFKSAGSELGKAANKAAGQLSGTLGKIATTIGNIKIDTGAAKAPAEVTEKMRRTLPSEVTERVKRIMPAEVAERAKKVTETTERAKKFSETTEHTKKLVETTERAKKFAETTERTTTERVRKVVPEEVTERVRKYAPEAPPEERKVRRRRTKKGAAAQPAGTFIPESIKTIGPIVSKNINAIAGQLNNTFGQIVGTFSNIKLNVGKKKPAKEGEDEGGGIMGMLGSTGGKAGIIGAGVAAGVMILKGIHDKIQKMLETLKEVSPAYKSMKDTTEKIWNLAMKPMGDFLATLMRPYIILAMQVLRPQLKQMYATIKAAGGKITPEVSAQLQGIFQNTMASLGSVFQNMMALVQPFAAQMDGFLSAIGLVFNNWLTGIGDWVNGLVQGIGAAFSGMPEALAQTFLNAAKMGEGAFSKLPDNMHAQFFDWIVRNPSKFPELAGDVRNEMFNWLINTPSELPKLSGDVATAFKTWLTTGEGADDLAGLPKDVAKKINKWLSDEAAQKAFTDAVNTAATTLGTALGTAGTAVKGVWDTFTSDLKTTLADVIQNVKNSITNEQQKSNNWFANLITAPITNLVSTAKSVVKAVAPVLGLPSHQAGTPFVPETGPAILHKGEAVLPTREAAAYRAGTNKNVTLNPTITINSNVRQEIDGDAIARRMARQTELNMRSLGLI